MNSRRPVINCCSTVQQAVVEGYGDGRRRKPVVVSGSRFLEGRKNMLRFLDVFCFLSFKLAFSIFYYFNKTCHVSKYDWSYGTCHYFHYGTEVLPEVMWISIWFSLVAIKNEFFLVPSEIMIMKE